MNTYLTKKSVYKFKFIFNVQQQKKRKNLKKKKNKINEKKSFIYEGEFALLCLVCFGTLLLLLVSVSLIAVYCYKYLQCIHGTCRRVAYYI